eukprot:5644843-Lingulodinium_polyedra.AAC.1
MLQPIVEHNLHRHVIPGFAVSDELQLPADLVHHCTLAHLLQHCARRAQEVDAGAHALVAGE